MAGIDFGTANSAKACSAVTAPRSSPMLRGIQHAQYRRDHLCVPKTSSRSCDQAVFADQATGVSLPSDAVPVVIDRFG